MRLVSKTKQSTFITLRINKQTSADLKTVAKREDNTQASVARRLITNGLSRELRSPTDNDQDR